MKLWKRFTAWLHYLRHPCTIITMDEAPVKGVKIDFTYTGEYPDTVENMQEALNKAMRPVDGTFKFSGHIDGDELAKHLDTDLLPALQKRAEESKRERETALKQAMDWPYGEPFKFAERANTLLEALIECGEHNRKLEDSMRKNSIECDACCKSHKVDMEYDVENLPQGWFTVIPGQGGGFKETVHFCSAKCLMDYAEKIQIVKEQQYGQKDQEERHS